MSTEDGAIWITEQDVAATVAMPAAIEAVRSGFLAQGLGRAQTMLKTHVAWPVGPGDDRLATLHAIGATIPGHALAGTKTWVHTPSGSQPLVVLFEAATGQLRAIIEAFTLGQLRTGAVSGVATDLLARPDASAMAIIGTGRQSLAQIAAVGAVRPIGDVRVAGRDRVRAARLVELVGEVLGLRATVADSVSAATDGADVVTLVTRARSPLLHAADLGPQAHLNAIGAITLERAEFEPSLLDRCRVLCVDSVDQVQALSAELREAFGSNLAQWARVHELGMLLAGGLPGPDGSGPSFFKAMGVGLADIVLAEHCVTQVVAAGRGRPLPHRPAEPDLLLAPFRLTRNEAEV